MTRYITDDCTKCGICLDECPVACISVKDGKYVIEESVCIDCAACAAVCPADASKRKEE